MPGDPQGVAEDVVLFATLRARSGDWASTAGGHGSRHRSVEAIHLITSERLDSAS